MLFDIKRLKVVPMAILVALLALPGSASADVVSFQQGIDGYEGTEDVHLIQTNPDNTWGFRHEMNVGNISIANANQARTLIRFDVSSLAATYPGGFTVNSATIRLTTNELTQTVPVAGFVNDSSLGDMHAHLVSAANSDWVEGQSTDGFTHNPTDGDPTYNFKQGLFLGGGTPWAGSAGAGTPGTDYDETPLGTASSAGAINTDVDFVLGGDLSFFNTWATGGTNGGFLLRADHEFFPNGIAARSSFYTSESAGSEEGGIFDRPELILDVSAGVASLTGDYNNNGAVDAADYTVWRDALGSAGPLQNDPLGGTISSAHYDQWVSNFGNTSSAGTGSLEIPEPTTCALAALGLLVALGARFRQG